MPLPEPTAKLARTLAREEVYDKLQGWAVDGTLRPGEILHDAKIAQLFGVSRTPVREALRRLEDEGLVETALNRWTRVAPINLGASIGIYSIIEVLEVFALQQVFTELTPQDLRQLLAANKAMRRAVQNREPAASIAADEAFHQVWVTRLANIELSLLIARLKTKLRRAELAYFGAAVRAQRSYREHAAIYRAVQQQKLPDAIAALRRNWQGSMDRLRRLVETKAGDLARDPSVYRQGDGADVERRTLTSATKRLKEMK
jgi:DNA-binding GntR family transcriptional regulator